MRDGPEEQGREAGKIRWTVQKQRGINTHRIWDGIRQKIRLKLFIPWNIRIISTPSADIRHSHACGVPTYMYVWV